MEGKISDSARLREAMAERIPAAVKLRKAELQGMTLEASALTGADFHGAAISGVKGFLLPS
ncbi:MAG: pentapeptide repeat-containing protein [Blastocatellia bacterium]